MELNKILVLRCIGTPNISPNCQETPELSSFDGTEPYILQWTNFGYQSKGKYPNRDICHEYFPSLIKFTQLAMVPIPLGQIAPAGNDFLAYLAKIITISQYAPRSTDTFLLQVCGTRVDELWITE